MHIKKLVFVLLMLLGIIEMKAQVAVWNGQVSSKFSSGSGTKDDPFKIRTAEELGKLAKDVNSGISYEGKYFELLSDIVLNTGIFKENGNLTEDTSLLVEWIPIGTEYEDENELSYPFKGNFNGNGHEIKGLFISNEKKDYTGLFGSVYGNISNLNISDSYITGNKYVAGIVGNLSGNISNCHNSSNISGGIYTAGIVAKYNGNIINCSNLGNINGNAISAGIAAIENFNSDKTIKTIMKCHNKGRIFSQMQAAGIIGSILSPHIIDSCYNEGTIQSCQSAGIINYITNKRNFPTYINNCINNGTISTTFIPSSQVFYRSTGGIVSVISNSMIEINKCANNGELEGYKDVGGIIGYSEGNVKGSVTLCYNKNTIAGQSNIGGIIGRNQSLNFYSCYNIGNIISRSDNMLRGSICGSQYTNTYYNCVYLKNENDNIYGTTSINMDIPYFIEGLSKEEFTNGKATWLLNARYSDKDLSKWFQNITTGQIIDTIPVWNTSHSIVYPIGECINAVNKFTNNPVSDSPSHVGNVICSICGEVIPKEPNLVDNIYQISNMNELYWYAALINKTLYNSFNTYETDAMLVNDITVNKSVLDKELNLTADSTSLIKWTPIGAYGHTFLHRFIGNNHTINGLYCNNPTFDYQGFFGDISSADTLSNFGIADSYFNGSSYTGTIAGKSSCPTENVYASNVLVKGRYETGGLFGCSENKISSSFFIGKVISDSQNGGMIVGSYYNDNDLTKFLSNCYYLNKGDNNYQGCSSSNDSLYYISQVTEQDVLNGKVTWLLNNKNTGKIAWYQNIDKTGIANDILPLLDNKHGIVYPIYGCPDFLSYFSNSEQLSIPEHDVEKGLCKICRKVIISKPQLIDSVYQISHAGELYWFASLINGTLEGVEKNESANAVLTENIILNDLNISSDRIPIVEGAINSWVPITNFCGSFDGQNHTIKGLYSATPYKNYNGLFSYINSPNAVIKNITIDNSYISGKASCTGGIIAKIFKNIVLENCTVTNSYISSSENVGGIVGYINVSNLELKNCHNKSRIIGTTNVGGIAGSTNGTIFQCSNEGDISGDQYIGGICGGKTLSTISSCYNSGKISGEKYISGITPMINDELSNCYNIGTIEGIDYIGGLIAAQIGRLKRSINNCYNIGEIRGETANIIGSLCGIPSSTAINYNNCYYLSNGKIQGSPNREDEIGVLEGRSYDDFSDGTIYSLLNNPENKGIWYQEIGKDLYPVLKYLVETDINDISISENKNVNVYTLTGILVKRNVPSNQALSGLKKGIYIIGGKKIIVP